MKSVWKIGEYFYNYNIELSKLEWSSTTQHRWDRGVTIENLSFGTISRIVFPVQKKINRDMQKSITHQA